MIRTEVQCLIYPKLSKDNELVIGVRSVELNANCAVRIKLPKGILADVLRCLEKCEFDMVMAHRFGKLIKDTKCKPCYMKEGKCINCGETYAFE